MKKHLIWRRLDQPGHEAFAVHDTGGEWELSGSAVFMHAGQPCRLDYRVSCDEKWRTRLARVTGWVGDQPVDCDIRVEYEGQRWWLNEIEQPQVAGCIDLDLNFSPATNTLPIRRLGLAVGQSAAVDAAWLKFPSFTLERLDQRYRRSDELIYRYESGGGAFRTDLNIDADGLVRSYPGIWRMES